MRYRLSLLDQSPLDEGQTPQAALAATLAFAQAADRLGYHRLWVSEHHDNEKLAGSSPEVLIAWLLAHTRRLRVGSGGVMLQHYSPYKVAENFHLLASLAPDRVDLGVGKAPGGLPLSTQALQGALAGKKDFAAQLTELTSYLNAAANVTPGTACAAFSGAAGAPFARPETATAASAAFSGMASTTLAAPGTATAASAKTSGAAAIPASTAISRSTPAVIDVAHAHPLPDRPPQRFLLGASPESARLAAGLGWNFVYAGFINASEQAMREAVLTFHEYAAQGKALISLAAVAADTEQQAASLLADRHNYRVTLGDRHVTLGSEAQAQNFIRQAGAADYRIEKQSLNVLHGTADAVHARLAALQHSLNVDEFILHTPLTHPGQRLRSITLLAGQQ